MIYILKIHHASNIKLYGPRSAWIEPDLIGSIFQSDVEIVVIMFLVVYEPKHANTQCTYLIPTLNIITLQRWYLVYLAYFFDFVGAVGLSIKFMNVKYVSQTLSAIP